MLHAGEDVAYTYVFTEMVPALAIITSAIAGNGVIVRKPPKGIVSKTAYATLISVLAQARNSLVDLIIA
jgi:hypothetical protein